MAKKDVSKEDVEVIEVDENASKKDKKTKDAKYDKSKEKSNKPNKQKKERKSLKKRIQEVWSELKKVSKPSFGKVCKDTCVVIAVVAICTVLLFGIDKLFSLVNGLLLP